MDEIKLEEMAFSKTTCLQELSVKPHVYIIKCKGGFRGQIPW